MNNLKETKICPYCKSEIDKKAVLCVHCGKRLPKKKTKWWLIPICVFAFFVIIGIIAPEEDPSIKENPISEENNEEETAKKEHTKKEEQKEEIVYTSVSVDDLVELLEENALKAEKKYQDSYLEITGVLDVIDSDGKYISLEPSDIMFSFLDVQCFIKSDEQLDKVLEMKTGDTVTLRGKITSIGEIIGYHLDIHEIK